MLHSLCLRCYFLSYIHSRCLRCYILHPVLERCCFKNPSPTRATNLFLKQIVQQKVKEPRPGAPRPTARLVRQCGKFNVCSFVKHLEDNGSQRSVAGDNASHPSQRGLRLPRFGQGRLFCCMTWCTERLSVCLSAPSILNICLFVFSAWCLFLLGLCKPLFLLCMSLFLLNLFLPCLFIRVCHSTFSFSLSPMFACLLCLRDSLVPICVQALPSFSSPHFTSYPSIHLFPASSPDRLHPTFCVSAYACALTLGARSLHVNLHISETSPTTHPLPDYHTTQLHEINPASPQMAPARV